MWGFSINFSATVCVQLQIIRKAFESNISILLTDEAVNYDHFNHKVDALAI